jgi:thiol-disulfide isomerase/thioredoxin
MKLHKTPVKPLKKATNKSNKKKPKTLKKQKSKTHKKQKSKTLKKPIKIEFDIPKDTNLAEPIPTTEEDLTKYKAVIVLVYNDDCIHCQRLKPDWEQLHHAHVSNPLYNSQIFIKDINSAQNMDNEILKLNHLLLNENSEPPQVIGFPTIGHYSNGHYHPYMGDRSFNDLNAFMENTLKN